MRGVAQLAAIEYPGPILPTSLNKALKTMGGLSAVSQALAAPAKDNRSLELSLNTRNPFSHPVPAHMADTGNVLMRVVKRRRKIPKRDEQGKVVEEGIYTLTPVGVITKTARFRGALLVPSRLNVSRALTSTPAAIADFQTSVDLQDPIVALSQSVRDMDGECVQMWKASNRRSLTFGLAPFRQSPLSNPSPGPNPTRRPPSTCSFLHQPLLAMSLPKFTSRQPFFSTAEALADLLPFAAIVQLTARPKAKATTPFPEASKEKERPTRAWSTSPDGKAILLRASSSLRPRNPIARMRQRSRRRRSLRKSRSKARLR